MFDINSSTDKKWMQIIHHESTVSFEAKTVSDAVIKSGTFVKINTAGLVAAITAITDVIVGVVFVGNDPLPQQAQRTKVTVYSNFRAIIRVKAVGAVVGGVIGDRVGFDATDKLPTASAPGTNGNRKVVFLKSAADGTYVNVGLL
jgi:hypothetical protein